MAAKQHTDFWGWASDHWFLTFLLASSAISIPFAVFSKPDIIVNPPAGGPPGPTPFPVSKT